MVKKGHSVTVFCRKKYNKSGNNLLGVQLVNLPAIYTKHLEAVTHTFLSVLFTIRNYDIVHFHALGPSLFSFFPKLFNNKVVVTVHGLDWKREKWNTLAKFFLKCGERMGLIFADSIIVVSRFLYSYYQSTYNKKVHYIPNGADPPTVLSSSDDPLGKLKLEKKKYIYFLGRIVPEKGIHFLIEAFSRLKTDYKLVISGEPTHSKEYFNRLSDLAKDSDRIIFTGPVFGEEKYALLKNAYFFVLPSTLEGLPIVLLEAMSVGVPVLCSNIPENMEIVHGDPGPVQTDSEPSGVVDYGVCFRSRDVSDLAEKLDYLLGHSDIVMDLGLKGVERIHKEYNWDSITEKTLDVYYSLL